MRVHPPARHTETVQIDHGAADFPYIQLAGILRGRINTGKYAPGCRLPTIAELIGETGLAPDTVRRAVGLLAGEGLVRTVPGRGTFVRLRSLRVARAG